MPFAYATSGRVRGRSQPADGDLSKAIIPRRKNVSLFWTYIKKALGKKIYTINYLFYDHE